MNRILAYAAVVSALLMPMYPLNASQLATYRGFQLNDGLASIAPHMGASPEDADVLHSRPALIQELTWRAEPSESVSQVVFEFYNSELFRMVVSYDRARTDGLTPADIIEAVSENYGLAAFPSADLSLSTIYNSSESVRVLARWEDADWSFNLVRSKYQSAFFLVALSKLRSPLAEKAMAEASRLDREEAPQRELDRQHVERERRQLEKERARVENKPTFQP